MNTSRTSPDPFLSTLHEHAAMQARLESTSWLPIWSKPFVALVGQRYALMLVIISLLVSIPITILTFPIIYRSFGGF